MISRPINVTGVGYLTNLLQYTNAVIIGGLPSRWGSRARLDHGSDRPLHNRPHNVVIRAKYPRSFSTAQNAVHPSQQWRDRRTASNFLADDQLPGTNPVNGSRRPFKLLELPGPSLGQSQSSISPCVKFVLAPASLSSKINQCRPALPLRFHLSNDRLPCPCWPVLSSLFSFWCGCALHIRSLTAPSPQHGGSGRIAHIC